MKLANNLARITTLLTVTILMSFGSNRVLSQTRPLKNGKMVLAGTTYNVSIRDGHDDIYIYNHSAYDKKRALNKIGSETVKIPEDFVEINTDKVLEIKRKFYPSSLSRVRVTVFVSKDGRLIGVEYTLPKSPKITENQFRTLDTQIRKHLKTSIVFPLGQIKKQKYDGYAIRTVVLK